MESIFADPTKIILAICAMASLTFNIWQYFIGRARLKVGVGIGLAPNENEIGNHLCLRVSITNAGNTPTYFSYIKAVQKSGDFFYPSFSIPSGTKIEANFSETGTIPIGHIDGQQITSLVIYDGVWKQHKVPKRQLHIALKELEVEKLRLAKIR